jgi:hypothetical protein
VTQPASAGFPLADGASHTVQNPYWRLHGSLHVKISWRNAASRSAPRLLSKAARQPFSAALKGNGPKPTFEFKSDRDNVLRGRIAVLIGPNGCEKTSSLFKLARGLEVASRDHCRTTGYKPSPGARSYGLASPIRSQSKRLWLRSCSSVRS